MSCLFRGKTYSEGAIICSNGRELKCRESEWTETGFTCLVETDATDASAGSSGDNVDAQVNKDGRP